MVDTESTLLRAQFAKSLRTSRVAVAQVMTREIESPKPQSYIPTIDQDNRRNEATLILSDEKPTHSVLVDGCVTINYTGKRIVQVTFRFNSFGKY